MIEFLLQVVVLLYVPSILVDAVTTTGDHCTVQGLYVPLGETWQPAGRCAEMTCVANNVTSTKGCSAPLPTEGWVLIPEDPSRPYPDCCSKYVSPDSPLASKPPLKPVTTNRPPTATNCSSTEDCEEDYETEVDSFESFDCCFHCCYQCCIDLMNNRTKHDFDSSEESIESDEYEED